MAAKVDKVDKAKIEILPTDRKYRFFLPWDDPDVRRMLVKHGHNIVLKESNEWDIALFTGGADIVPLLYGEKMLNGTSCNFNRDMREVSFYKGLHPKRLKVGICRGAQLLNVLSGGRLWQDVNNHAVHPGHDMEVTYENDRIIKVSSRHHQMMIPGPNAWVMGASKESTRKENQTFGVTEFPPQALDRMQSHDPEVVYYGETHSLCFQPHPEDDDVPECTEYFFEAIDNVWSDKYHEESLKEW